MGLVQSPCAAMAGRVHDATCSSPHPTRDRGHSMGFGRLAACGHPMGLRLRPLNRSYPGGCDQPIGHPVTYSHPTAPRVVPTPWVAATPWVVGTPWVATTPWIAATRWTAATP